jgi:hypothetical protein
MYFQYMYIGMFLIIFSSKSINERASDYKCVVSELGISRVFYMGLAIPHPPSPTPNLVSSYPQIKSVMKSLTSLGQISWKVEIFN